jgi:hypothetical protein
MLKLEIPLKGFCQLFLGTSSPSQTSDSVSLSTNLFVNTILSCTFGYRKSVTNRSSN